MIITDYLINMMFFYVPTVYLMQPRRGKRYVNYLLFVFFYNCWAIPWRYIVPPSNTLFYQMMNQAMIFILFLIFYRCKIKKRILLMVAVFLIGLFSEISACLMLVTMTTDFWIKYVHAQFDGIFLDVSRLLGALAGEVVSMIWALTYLCLMKKRRWRIFLGFMLIPVYQTCLTAGFFIMCGDFTESTALAGFGIILFNLLLDGVILYLLEGIFKKLDWEEELRMLEEQRRQEYVYYEADSQYVNEMRLMRHDFANQLQTAYSMMDEPESVERVKALLEEMREKIGGENETLVRDRCGFS